MCSGRIDPEFVLRALSNGNDGVYVGGCWLGECHYITEGNYDALSMMHLCKRLMKQIGLDPDRLRLEWVSASEGNRFAEIVTEFTTKVRFLGQLGKGEGIDDATLKRNLEAIRKLLPYIKLVEREKIRVRFKTREEYDAYFSSEEFERIFKAAVADKLAVAQILEHLKSKPLTTGEIAENMHMTPSEIAKHLNITSRQRLVRFDSDQKRYALV